MSLNNFSNFKNPSHYTIGTFKKNSFDGAQFNQAFKNQATLIPPRDTKNYGNTIINNIGENVVNEVITEYTIHIDSSDRDINAYPNPYQFTVSIGGAGSSVITQSQYVNQNNQSVLAFANVAYTGAPGPRIDVPFRNVKYIKLKYVSLPRIITYKYTEDSTTGKISYDRESLTASKSTILGNYRYLIMRIKEIANDNFYSTDANIKNNCFILYRDSNYYDAISDLWIATQPVKIFYDDDLKNLSRMTIEIFIPPTSTQQPASTQIEPQTNARISLGIQQEYNTKFGYPLPQDSNLIFFTLLRREETGTTFEPMPVSDVNGTSKLPDKTSASNFYEKFGMDVQTSMEFEIGVCENQINTGKNYR
jgi:hypothetical protein